MSSKSKLPIDYTNRFIVSQRTLTLTKTRMRDYNPVREGTSVNVIGLLKVAVLGVEALVNSIYKELGN